MQHQSQYSQTTNRVVFQKTFCSLQQPFQNEESPILGGENRRERFKGYTRRNPQKTYPRSNKVSDLLPTPTADVKAFWQHSFASSLEEINTLIASIHIKILNLTKRRHRITVS